MSSLHTVHVSAAHNTVLRSLFGLIQMTFCLIVIHLFYRSLIYGYSAFRYNINNLLASNFLGSKLFTFTSSILLARKLSVMSCTFPVRWTAVSAASSAEYSRDAVRLTRVVFTDARFICCEPVMTSSPISDKDNVHICLLMHSRLEYNYIYRSYEFQHRVCQCYERGSNLFK